MNNYGNYRVYIDLNGDGKADGSVAPDAQGRITSGMIESALRQENGSDATKPEDLPSGLIIGSAWLTTTSSSTRLSETLVLWVNHTDLEETEYNVVKAQEGNLLRLLDEYQEALLDAINASQNNETPVTQHNTLEDTGEETPSTSGQLAPGITAADRDKILNTTIPAIPEPNFGSELIDLSKDPAYKDAIKTINDQYAATVKTAQTTFENAFDPILKTYTQTVGRAWETYAKEYDKLLKEYDKIKAEDFFETQKYKDVNTAHTARKNAITAQNTAETTAANAAYSSKLALLSPLDDIGYLNARFELERDMLVIRSSHEERIQDELIKYCCDMASARTAFEIDKVARMLVKAEAMATARKTYELAVADANKTALTALAPHMETYRNAVANAWGTAVNGMYTKVVEIVTQWKNTNGTDAGWANYVLTLVNNAKTETATLVTAYKQNVSANVAAEKAASLAQAGAGHAASVALAGLRETASHDAAQRSATLQNEKWSAQKNYELALSESKRAVAQEEIALWRGMTASQMDTMYNYQIEVRQRRDALEAECVALIAQYGTLPPFVWNELYVRYGKAAENAAMKQERIWQTIYLNYHLAMQPAQDRYAKKAAELYETYENDLTDGLSTYWTNSVTVGASLQTSLDSLTNQYVAALNAVSDSYSDSVLTAGQSFDASSLDAAEDRVEADNTADSNRLDSVMTSFIAAVGNAYSAVTGAVGSWLTSNLTSTTCWFNSEKTSTMSLVTDLLGSAVAGIGLSPIINRQVLEV